MLALALTLLSSLAPCSEQIVREGEHFQLVCHFQNEAAADQAMAAVEAIWPRAEQVYDLSREREREPLVVHLYRDAAAYERAEEALTHGRFKRNLAFAHIDSLSAHVALQPPLTDEALAKLGVPAQTLRLLAHEGAHLVRYSHMNNSSSHPGWLYDGAASWIDEQVSRDLGLLDGIEQDPCFSTNILRVQGLLERGELPTMQELLRDKTSELEFYERYDVRWMFFRFMLEGEHAKKFGKLVRQTRSLGGGANFTERLFKKSEALFSKSRRASLDEQFREYIEAFEPAWDEVYRSLYFRDGLGIQAAFGVNAIAWQRTPAGSEEYSIGGELSIAPGENPQMNLFLGRSDQGFCSVAFRAGSVTLFEYLSETGKWLQRGYAKCEGVQEGDPFEFSVRVTGSRVSVEVQGAPVTSGEMQTLGLEGPFGLSAQAHSAGTWKLRDQ